VKGLLLISAVLAVVVLYAAVGTDSGLRAWRRMHGDLAGAEARIAKLREDNADLERSAAALEADAFAIESAIREDLGLSRRGERILRLRGPGHTNPRFP
jgi:cell division protein FtsB